MSLIGGSGLRRALHACSQQYVDELRSCLGLEAADQPLTPAAVRVVKLANEIVRAPDPAAAPAAPGLSPMGCVTL